MRARRYREGTNRPMIGQIIYVNSEQGGQKVAAYNGGQS